MIDSDMTSAVRRALAAERETKLPKKTENKDKIRTKAQSGISGNSAAPEKEPKWVTVPKPATVYQEIYQSLSPARRLTPEHCPYPDELCRGCPQAAGCG